jgi:hypothetical protein
VEVPHMKRLSAGVALLLLTAAPLSAQKPPEGILLKVYPAEPPQPSLKYRLFPDRGQLTEGNAPTQYYRALSLFVENQALLAEIRGEYWDDWLATPPDKLPRKEADGKVRMCRYLIRELQLASKRKQCDWQLENRSEGIGLLVPDVQGFRMVVRPLAMRVRLAVADKNYAEACEMLQVGYALAYHLGRGPTLIHVLVGMAISNIMTTQLETLLEQPDAPNLYWALAAMPKPFADLQPALQQETVWIENMFPFLKQVDMTPMSEDQVKAFDAKVKQATQDFGLRSMTVGQRMAQGLALTQATAEGKIDLVERFKMAPEKVAEMPAAQIAALYSFREYKESLEEIVKWSNIPEGWKHPDYDAAQKRYGKAVQRLDDLYFRGLLFGLGGGERFPLKKVSLAAARVDRRFAALRVVEAIRQHAAKHQGELPASLDEVKGLPVPNDPLTGKAFEYAVKGDKATLTLAKPDEEKPLPNQFLTYYIMMKRNKE